ncbi:MAG TPA: nickel-binding protein [Sediminibacterium sp.]
MKRSIWTTVFLVAMSGAFAQKSATKKFFMDVHQMEPGKVTFDAVMEAHQKDLKTGPEYGVDFMKFWVDEKKGLIYCLASAGKASDLTTAHKHAHGLLPKDVYEVKSSMVDPEVPGKQYFMDFHYVGPGQVTEQAVAGAHEKDLSVQRKYGVNLINYWLDEKKGVIFCLAQAADSAALINTHKEAHGLLPNTVQTVKQGQ